MALSHFIDELSKAQIPPETIKQVLLKSNRILIKNQTKLIVPGKVCEHVYFVLKGGFVCRYIEEELKIEKTINFFLDDFQPFMTCVDSYFSGNKTNCELRAICEAELLVFQKKDIEFLSALTPELTRFYYSLLMMGIHGENDFKMKIIAYSSKRLYAYLIANYPVIIQRVPARFIAEFMGVSQEWLSKLKHQI